MAISGEPPRRRRPLAVASSLLAAAALAGWGIAGLRPSRPSPAPAAAPAAQRAMQLTAHQNYWSQALAGAVVLGPSTARRVSVTVSLATGSHRPDALVEWAKQRHLNLIWVHGEPAAVLSGTALALGSALGDPIRDYRAARGGRTFFAAARAATVPSALKGLVNGIGTIDSYGTVQKYQYSAPSGGLTPIGFLQAYDAVPLAGAGIDGTGQTIVFLETDGYNQSDLDAYSSQFDLTSVNPTVIGGDAPAGGEAPMDLEVGHGIAPGAKIVYWNLNISGAGQLASAFTSAVTQATSQFPGAIYSVSLGFCEQAFGSTDVDAAAAAVAAAEKTGSSFFVASGDSGGEECLTNWGDSPNSAGQGVSFPSDLPDVTAVGGTALDVATTGAWLGETTWSEPLLSGGSTGGVSTLVTMPSWQQGPGVVSANSSQVCKSSPGTSTGLWTSTGLCRELPDVAADADPATGAAVIEDGQPNQIGGTSLAAPIWAGLTALIDQRLNSLGDDPVGFGNPDFYRLAASPPTGSPAFHDITVGGNDWYPAGPGYDLVTGLGSPIVSNLATDLARLVGKSGGG